MRPMSWAAQRKMLYVLGIVLLFIIAIGGPVAYSYFSTPATCSDGSQNQGETGIDMGGPCLTLDARYLQPHATLWARSFKVRDGTYNALAYIQNPNRDAGTPLARYRFSLYDSANVLIAEREGASFIMPGSVTPIFESRIDTGNRIVAHTYFEFVDPLIWKRMRNSAIAISVGNKEISDVATSPRVSAEATNSSVSDILDPSFIAIVYDPSGNAFAASQTALSRLAAGGVAPIVFTWSDPYGVSVGRVDITPVSAPISVPTR